MATTLFKTLTLATGMTTALLFSGFSSHARHESLSSSYQFFL